MKKSGFFITIFLSLLVLSPFPGQKSIIYEWDFGDGSPPVFEQNPKHAYAQPGTYTWTLKIRKNGLDCVKTGTITVRSNIPSQIGVSRRHLYFGATKGLMTDPQVVSIRNRGADVLEWKLRGDADWLDFLPYGGTNTGDVTVSIDPSGLQAGTYEGKILIQDPFASNSPQEVEVTLNVMDAHAAQPPFGIFSTPQDRAVGISGAIPITGWVLDDIAPEKVEIWRDAAGGEASGLVYIGDAVFVEGARPDVEQAYPEYPLNHRAGWGYMLLTNLLPNQGNGTFNIHAYATDKEGHTVKLGTKIISCDNSIASKPFGTIDDPGQGESVAGKIWNYGWALTPQPFKIPEDGSTIRVWIDGKKVGQPEYNQRRQDIVDLFPGYANSEGAVGAYLLDTGQYPNGVHTIAWSVEDDGGRQEGIGSRYFTISNIKNCCDQNQTTSLGMTSMNSIPFENIAYLPEDRTPIRIKKGFRHIFEPESIAPDEYGILSVEIYEVERLEIDIGWTVDAGFVEVGNELRDLPVGSILDNQNGIFFWQPGPGFVGKYTLVFVDSVNNLAKKVNVNIRPKYEER